MKKQGKGFWRDMYTAAKQGSVDFLLLQLLSLEKQMVSEVFLSQLKRLIQLALLKKREKEEKLVLAYHRKRLNEAVQAEKKMIYASQCVFWQR